MVGKLFLNIFCKNYATRIELFIYLEFLPFFIYLEFLPCTFPVKYFKASHVLLYTQESKCCSELNESLHKLRQPLKVHPRVHIKQRRSVKRLSLKPKKMKFLFVLAFVLSITMVSGRLKDNVVEGNFSGGKLKFLVDYKHGYLSVAWFFHTKLLVRNYAHDFSLFLNSL